MRVGHVGQSGGHTRNEHEPHSAAQASWNEAHGALPLYFNPRVTPRCTRFVFSPFTEGRDELSNSNCSQKRRLHPWQLAR